MGNALLHLAGEGEEGANRLPRRHVLARRDPVPRAHRRRAFRRRRRDRSRQGALQRPAQEAKRTTPRAHSRNRRACDEDARARQGEPLSKLRGASGGVQGSPDNGVNQEDPGTDVFAVEAGDSRRKAHADAPAPHHKARDADGNFHQAQAGERRSWRRGCA